MITGDNVLTAIDVAKTSQIIEKGYEVIFCKYEHDD